MLLSNTRPFSAIDQSSQTLAVTGASQALTLPTAVGTRSIRISTTGTVVVFWRYTLNTGGGGAATTAASVPMLPGVTETFLLPNDATAINFIASGVGTTVYITIGESA